ncbi:MAG: C1 family peptidase [Treponema sp.]|nr:C1 family peptidase [Treponema sp.]
MKKLLILPLFLLLSPLFGQEYGTGAILDPVRYEQTDAKPVLISRSYNSLPRSVSLKQYSPIPESQGIYGTCTAWSTAFAARTISESIALNRTDRTETSNNVFSPVFVYKGFYSLTGINPTGHEGVHVSDALNFMKNEGAVKRLTFERTTPLPLIMLSAFTNSRRYPIADYVRLFSNYWGGPGTIAERVVPVKKSLSEGKPVIIVIKFFYPRPNSFDRARDVWQPTESPDLTQGGHALCVVGYDDDMYGGAFEIQNSWGTSWGNDGYIWVRYSDFAAFVYEAYEIIEHLALYRDATRFAASIEIDVFNDNRGMPVNYNSQGFYRTRFSYPLNTIFQFQMTNRYPAYVYAFSADDSSSDIERIFPMPGVSPVLDYADSTVAWPGENEGIMIASTAGTHYLVVLYAKEALDIEAIERRFAEGRGAFPERVARAVGSNFIPYRNVQYKSDAIEFSAESRNPRSVFGLLLAIEHHAR